MENGGYLFAAFAIVWAVIFAYIFFLSRKQRELKREMGLLRERMTKKSDV